VNILFVPTTYTYHNARFKKPNFLIFLMNFQFYLIRITYNIQIYYAVICVAVYIMPIYLLRVWLLVTRVSGTKEYRLSNSQHRRCLSTRQPLNVGYMTLPEYWVITSKPQRILAARSNKFQQNPKPAEADEQASCRA
jgi:hypothetical protein